MNPPKWEAYAGNEIGGSGLSNTDLTAWGGLALVRGRDEQVRAFDPATGALRESQLHPAVDGARAQIGPVVDGDIAYVGDTNGRVYGLDPRTGERRWEYAAPTRRLSDVAAAAGTVYVAAADRVIAVVGGGT